MAKEGLQRLQDLGARGLDLLPAVRDGPGNVHYWVPERARLPFLTGQMMSGHVITVRGGRVQFDSSCMGGRCASVGQRTALAGRISGWASGLDLQQPSR